MSLEAVFVMGLLVITLFVLFPPVLNLLNQGAETSKAEEAMIGAKGVQTQVTQVDSSGNVTLAVPSVVSAALQSLTANLAENTQSHDAVSLAAVTLSDCSGSGPYIGTCSGDASDPCVTCSGSPPSCVVNDPSACCCVKYDGTSASYGPCNAAEISELEQIAQNYVAGCTGGTPCNMFGVPSVIKTPAGLSLASGNLCPFPEPIGTGRTPAPTPIGASGSGGAPVTMLWGEVQSDFARNAPSGDFRCPLKANDPEICCTISANGTPDLNTCSPCTAQELQTCQVGG